MRVPLPSEPSVVRPAVETVSCAGRRDKRLVDVVGALLLLAALAVKLCSPGPVLFRQARIGRDPRDFMILKFRTTCEDAEDRLERDDWLPRVYRDRNHQIPCHLDPRVTGVGRFLRTSSLDELPQLFNVLAGHMSLVGPPSVELSQLASYGKHRDAYLELRPGLTGVCRRAAGAGSPFPALAELDASYRDCCSSWVDEIRARTPLTVMRRLGAD